MLCHNVGVRARSTALPGESSTAFVSYSRVDAEEFALRLAEDLKKAGASIWLDQLELEPGKPWDTEIERALATCPRMLAILSPRSVSSANVLDEVNTPYAEGKQSLSSILSAISPSASNASAFAPTTIADSHGCSRPWVCRRRQQVRTKPLQLMYSGKATRSARNVGPARPTRGTAAGTASPQQQARDLIFISYSHADDDLCKQFLKMVRPTAQKRGLKIWSDHEISVGTIWRDEIEKALARTRITVLLVSPDFLASGFIEKNELPPLLEAARTQGAHIFLIACRPCNVEDTELGKFQGANPSKPLSVLSRVAREKEMQRISQQLFRLSQAPYPGSSS